MIEDARGCVDYAECGQGPSIVLVPGSCSTGAAWRPIVAEWGYAFRCISTSLLGYGGTAERRSLGDADIAHEAEMLEAVVRQAGRRVHLVGHSFGGLVALAVTLRKQVPLASLTIIEAPAPDILRRMGEHRHYAAFREMTDRYSAAFRAGAPDAIAAMIDFYDGAGSFAAWPERVRAYAVATTPANLLDWESAYGFRLTPATLASVEVSTMVLMGGDSHPAVRRANELLAACMSNACAASLEGAAHFMIATHAEKTARIIARHVAHVELMGLATVEA